MQILVRTDNHIAAHEQHLIRLAEQEISTTLARFADRVSRVDVHLADESAKPTISGDKRCTIEARLVGAEPVSVTSFADTVVQALTATARMLEELLDRRFERLHQRKGAPTIRH